MRPVRNFVRSAKSVVSLVNRSFSSQQSTHELVRRVTIPNSISTEFHRLVSKACEPYQDPSFQLKGFTKKEGEAAASKLQELIAAHGDFQKEVEDVKESKPMLVVLDGITVTEVEKSQIPTSYAFEQDFEQKFARMIRGSEMIAYSHSKLFFDPWNGLSAFGIVNPVFATKEDADIDTSYRSAKKLRWHVDGWGEYDSSIPDYVMLLGLVGKKDVRTDFVSTRDIIDYFKKSGKEEFLDLLSGINYLESEDYLAPITIIDVLTGKINYAQYGDFRSRSGKTAQLRQAINFMNDGLDSGSIPSFGISIDKGQAVIARNQEGLHRKVTLEPAKSSPSESPSDSVGSRLLLRTHGAEK